MEIISIYTIKKALLAVIKELNKNKQHFNDLDAPIGDSDHGDSICFTFRLVQEAVEAFDIEKGDIGSLLNEVGKSIVFSGGAAMGPLYGTAFMDAGKAVGEKRELNHEDITELWNAFMKGIERRGKVKTGEKTMFDTIFPAVQTLADMKAEGKSLSESVPHVIKSAEDGMNSTKDMLSLRGRSSRLGERSLGHIDPGSASMFSLVSVFFSVVNAEINS